jgi:hypothetical protein
VDHATWVHESQAWSTVDRIHSLSPPLAYGAPGAHISRRGRISSRSFLMVALSPVVSSLALALWQFDEAARGLYGIVGLWGTSQGAIGGSLGL